ncbi:ABC transporter permease [Paenibacillus wynnii]|uniref:ABC transporter permease n=1 Tax=Paenibacillus wynnii TaxID=268407 RepID=UPI00278F481D|nr:ABC transporter permease [Paenibacillus wynnii]MDQ0195588.1 putative hydroxymethylpyrimidine transport system permease protein [Paenibacillus wynnii]
MILTLLKRYLRDYGLALLLLLFLLVCWETVVRLEWIPSFILPAPTSIWIALVENQRLLFGQHLPATLQEVFIGFILSVVLGSLLGTGMHLSRRLEKALYPFIIISQTIPLIALSPIFIFWFGYSLAGKVAVVFLTAFFPVVVGSFDGLRKGAEGYRELLLTMGASRRHLLTKIQIPLALPSFFSGLKLSIVYCVIGATIGEWLGGSKGLGYFSRRMAGNLQSDEMFAAVFLLSALGLVLFLILVLLEKILFMKRGSSRS